jgi:hypothetical protein
LSAAMSVRRNGFLFGSTILPHCLVACHTRDVPVGLGVTVLSGRPNAAAGWNVRDEPDADDYDYDYDYDYE